MIATTDNKTAEWTPQIGDRVTLAWGLGRITGEITENRGAIGHGGRNLWRVRAFIPPANRFYTEVPVTEMQPLPMVRRAKRVIGRRKVAAR